MSGKNERKGLVPFIWPLCSVHTAKSAGSVGAAKRIFFLFPPLSGRIQSIQFNPSQGVPCAGRWTLGRSAEMLLFVIGVACLDPVCFAMLCFALLTELEFFFAQVFLCQKTALILVSKPLRSDRICQNDPSSPSSLPPSSFLQLFVTVATQRLFFSCSLVADRRPLDSVPSQCYPALHPPFA